MVHELCGLEIGSERNIVGREVALGQAGLREENLLGPGEEGGQTGLQRGVFINSQSRIIAAGTVEIGQMKLIG